MRFFWIFVLGSDFLLTGCLLMFAGPLLKIGINDCEWRSLSAKGLFSAPDELTWTSWRPNDGSVTPFAGFPPKQPIAEFRTGRAQGFLFDFTVYEGRAVDGSVAIPALGPEWGASYNYRWAILALILGMILLSFAIDPRRIIDGKVFDGVHEPGLFQSE